MAMTHDELLAKIDQFDNLCGRDDKSFARKFGYQCAWNHGFAEALRAVVELHPMWTDYKYTETDKELVEFCGCCQEKYPCPTIQAIQKELS